MTKKGNWWVFCKQILKIKEKCFLNSIVHFKELFALDGKTADLSDNDLQRRNTIAKLLVDWGLVKISNPDYFTDYAPLSQIKVISHKEKNEWMLETKYNIGKKKLTTHGHF